MEYTKLGTIAEFIMGQAPNSELCNKSGVGVPFVKAGQFNKLYPLINEWTTKPLKMAKDQDILICVVGATSGKINLGVEAAIGRSVAAIRCNPEKINYKFLYYYLNTWVGKIREKSQGSAIGVITKDMLYEIKVPFLSLDIQLKIVNILDNTYELIDKRKIQIQQLDELVKSRFIEMFGDPVKNPKGWEKTNIGAKFEIKTGATPSRKENTYWENGTIPWIKTTELKEIVINNTEEYITEEGYNNSSVNLLPKDTILIAMYGQGKTRGMTGKLGIEATTNQACASILPNGEENMDFVWYQLKLSYEDLRNLGRGGSQPNLNTNLIKSYELIFPPIELQDKFVGFVYQVDKLKFEMEKSLKELEDNFNSLIQKAFKGELF